ncbi:hypothetical protein M9Y10_041418 [Tritrichomonas musculus]|uniref:Uncharacterized protein n=1 Tax=Tritrichomonas musculus TaxID=1915356 RepID=A0ABR2K498_9EUKA
MISETEILNFQSLFLYKELHSSNEKVVSKSIYRILSFLSPTQFLVLATSTYFQQIYLYNMDSSSKKLLLTLPIHKKIISSSLSTNEDKLFVVLYSPQNCFSKRPFYTVHCYITNSNISYPVSVPIFNFIPKIECAESNTKFIFSSNNDQFEIYDILCNENEFQLHLDRKSKNGVIWWNLKDKNQIEYVKVDPKKGKFKFFCSQRTFHLPILPNPLPSDFFYLNGDLNKFQDVILFLSKEYFGIILPFSQLEIKLSYKKKIENYSLSNFMFFKNDLFIGLTPQRTFIFILLNSISQPRSAFEIKINKNREEQYLRLTSFHALNCINQNTGVQFSISYDYKSLILADSRLFIPFFHYSIMDNKEKTFEFNFENKSIRIHHQCDFFSLLTDNILETFWNGTVFQEYFLCIFLRDIFQYLPQKQKDFFIYHSTTFCPTFHFRKELKKFTQFQINDTNSSNSSQQFDHQLIKERNARNNQINSWGILKIEDSNTFLEYFNICSHNSSNDTDYYYNTSIYEILIDLILSFTVENVISDNLHFYSLIQITSLLSSVTDLSLNVNSNLFKKNNRDSSLLDKTKEVVFNSLSKSCTEFWEVNKIIKSSVSLPEIDTDSNFGTKILTKNEARASWWKIHLNTRINEITEQTYGNSIFDAFAEVTTDADESIQRSLISFYRPYFSDNF